MEHYPNDKKQAIKQFILEKVSKTLDDALNHLETSYAYDSFHAEVMLDYFHGVFKLHFTPKNEMNDGKNYSVLFSSHDKEFVEKKFVY